MHVGDDIRTRHARDDANRAGTGQTQGPDPAPTLHAPRRSSVEPEPVTNLTTTSVTTTTTTASVSGQGTGAPLATDRDSASGEAQGEPAPPPARQSARRAYQAVRALARQGSAEAQNDLALCYLDGRGVKKNRSKAARWFQAAAEQGHSFAQAWCLWHGSGVQTNLAAAVELYMRSATSGHVDAMWRLGLCYEHGWCVQASDANIALQMFQLAAMKGNADGQFHLARSYYYGIGTPQSKMEAVYWFALSEGKAKSAIAQPMRLLELLEQALRDFDTALQEELPRIENFLARSLATEPEPGDGAEDAPGPEPEPRNAPEPGAGQEPAGALATGDSPEQAGQQPAADVEDARASSPSRPGAGLPHLQELSEPSSTPSTESGNSAEGDEAEEGNETNFEWQVDPKESNSTFS